MAIELLDMIKKGDDPEGWVQTKLNLAADYHKQYIRHEDYPKLNPTEKNLTQTLYRDTQE